MKVVILLLTLTFSHVAASSYAQKVSINIEEASLESVLLEIQEQTGFDFLYNSAQIQSVKLYDLHFSNTDLDAVLNACLENEGLIYEIDNQTVLIKKNDSQAHTKAMSVRKQQREVTGRVVDELGEPVIGVTVSIEGTSIGTSTDKNGEYYLEIPAAGTLVFSLLGYKPFEVDVTSVISPYDVVLEAEVQGLEEVVVVGYGTQKRVNLTGAVGHISSEEIAARPDANIAGTLQGLIPGLNIQVNSGDPTATPDINIRGFNSINGGSPLVLVDGIEGDITRVNPLDIESISVLKDAASAAIYGARGAFGVILITTKEGKTGDMTVNYSNNFGWSTPTTRTDFISDPYLYGKTIDAAIYGYNGSSYTDYDEMDWEAIKMVATGEIEPFHELQSNGTYKFFYNTNWYDYLFKEWQPSQNHNISISGGSDRLKAYLSGRLYQRETIQNIVDADMDRYNLKANLSFQANDWLEISNNIQFVHEKDEDYGGFRNGYGGIWSTTTWYDLFPFYPNMIDGMAVDVGKGGGGQGGAAAMEDANNWRRFGTEELTNTFRVKVNPIEGLEFNFDYSNRIDNTNRTYRYNEFEYLTTHSLTLQTVGINRLGEWRWKDKYNAMNIFGTYSKSFNDDHNFKLLLGYNQEDFERDRIVAQSDGLLIRDLSNLALGTEMYNMDGSALVWAVRGYFGRFNYDYKGKYLLEINTRYDGSSRFPTGSQWGLFPSVSAGWQIDRESFWDPLESTISLLKLRASYGKLGNQNVAVNTFQQLMGVGTSSWLDHGNRINYASAPGPLPRVVSWESTKTTNLGLDIGFLQNKLLASIDLFQKDVEGMYLPGEPLPAVFGASEPKENLASLKNKGFELSINYSDQFVLGDSPFNFSASASVSNFKGVITKYENPEGLMSTYWEGQELGQIWGYRVEGQFQSDEEAAAYQSNFQNPGNSIGNVYNYILNVVQNSEWNRLRAGDIKYIDLDGDGRIDRGDYTLEDHGDIRPIGNAMPKFPFGFNLRASWKGFDLAIAGAGVAKQNWYPTGDIYWGPYQRPYLSFIRKDLVENAWTPEAPGNTYPQIYRGYASLNGGRSLYEMNDYYLKNIGYLRVKNMTLGYTLPESLTQKINVERFRIYFSGENLLTWRFGDLTKYIDPEQAGSAINYSNPGNAVGRADLRAYPMGKTYSIGINLTL